jgi:diguanylate cyclase (GGDEF)-like protein
MGGDEFVLVLPDTREEGARTICERVLESYRKSGSGPTALSIGIATDRDGAPPDAEAAVQQLLARADRTMYAAKEAGGDRACVETRERGK